MQTKKQKDIVDLKRLKSELLENAFTVHRDKDDMYFYNLLNSVHFPHNLPRSMFTSYQIAYGDTWPFISYKTIGTPNAWWIILLANKIDNPIIMPANGTRIKIPIESVVRTIIQKLNE